MTGTSATRPRGRALVFVVAAVLAACSPGGDPARDAGETPGGGGREAVEEAVDLRVVELPDTVTGARFPIYAAGGDRIVFSATPAGGRRVEVMSVAEDGSDLRCLSCGARGPAAQATDPLLKPIPLADGRRVAVRVGEQSPIAPADHAILECTPSVADCTSAALLPLVPPAAGDPGVVQDQREARIAPDGETVGLTQVRRRPGGDNALVALVGRLHRAEDGSAYTVESPRVVSTLGELKNFTPDGAGVLVAAFTTLPDRVADPDIVRVDLATGEEERVTVDGDYDEDIGLSPDQNWYVVASGRGSGLFETVSQVRRPNFVGRGLEPLTAYLFANHRRELLEPWLVRVGAEADGERGQQLNPASGADGWDARTLMTWHPAGDRIVFWEATGDPFGPPAGGDTRIVVAHLTDRTAAAPADRADGVAARPSPEATWAPPLAGFVPPPLDPQPSRAGRASGTATVTEGPGPAPGQRVVEVRYDDFSDDGEWVVDGTESAAFDEQALGSTTYTADLTLSGGHEGYLRADARITAGAIDGAIESQVDGHTLRLP